MTNFNPAYQTEKDGTLTDDVRKRLNKFRELGYTLAQIGDATGFSGAFMSSLLSEKSPGRIRSVHMPKFIKTLEDAEKAEGLVKGGAPKTKKTLESYSLEELINAIKAKGFTVQVS